MKKTCIVLCVFLLIPQWKLGAAGGAPAWYLESIATLTAGSGRWTTDNSRYKSAEEAADEYVTEWKASFDGATMTGRLFGIADGEESVDYWEFREYWHPGREEVVVEQFGWGGVVGIGTMWLEGEQTVSEQEFIAPDGRRWRAGHRSRFEGASIYVTDSFDIKDGIWTERRSYTWSRTNVDD